MVKKAKSQRNKRRVGRASEENKAEISYTAPTPGLKNVLFTRGTTRDAVTFIDTLDMPARHVRVQAWSQSTVAAKAMIELVAPSYTHPLKPVRLYYVTPALDAPASDRLVKTTDRFVPGTTTKYVAVDDDIDWKMELSEYMIENQKYQKDTEAWTENSACVYNLVLGHCPP